MLHKILVGSYTDRITTLQFDSEAKSLCVHSNFHGGQNPSWLAQHPTDKSLIFAANEVTDGKIQLLKLAEDASLSFLEEFSSLGADPAFLNVSEDAVIVANYSSGSVLVVPLSPITPHLQQPRQALVTFEGNGPNKTRQESSHPHQVIFHHKPQEEILVPDLGTDKVWRLTKNTGGIWDVAGYVDFPSGTGPRHAVVHDNIIYTALELVNEVASHTLPELPGKSVPLESLPSLPDDKESNADMALAEILFSTGTPTHPSPLLYVSNRNEGLPTGDTIAIYTPHQRTPSTESDGSSQLQFRLINSVATGLHHLRGMAIEGKDARYIVAGGTNGGGIKVFERVGANLIEVASTEAVEKPASFLWV